MVFEYFKKGIGKYVALGATLLALIGFAAGCRQADPGARNSWWDCTNGCSLQNTPRTPYDPPTKIIGLEADPAIVGVDQPTNLEMRVAFNNQNKNDVRAVYADFNDQEDTQSDCLYDFYAPRHFDVAFLNDPRMNCDVSYESVYDDGELEIAVPGYSQPGTYEVNVGIATNHNTYDFASTSIHVYSDPSTLDTGGVAE